MREEFFPALFVISATGHPWIVVFPTWGIGQITWQFREQSFPAGDIIRIAIYSLLDNFFPLIHILTGDIFISSYLILIRYFLSKDLHVKIYNFKIRFRAYLLLESSWIFNSMHFKYFYGLKFELASELQNTHHKKVQTHNIFRFKYFKNEW